MMQARIAVRPWQMVALAFAASMPAASWALYAHGAQPPNVVIILADDMGYGDVGAYGGPIATPNIDRLATEGLLFTDAYAGSSLCAPSRATLLLGGHTGHVEPRGNRNTEIGSEETTLAELLVDAGYATGLYGKWGFGHADQPGTHPIEHGWQEYLAYLGHLDAQDHTPDVLYSNNGPVQAAGAYAPDLFEAEALKFIDRHADRPFLLYMASALPHGPFEVPGMEDRPLADIYAAMVQRLDTTVGRLVARLEERDIAERTLVLVTSDNGSIGLVKSADGWRGEKGSLYEGGIRVPMIAWWPGTVAPGVTQHIAAGWDIFATTADLAGAGSSGDGISFVPLLLDQAQPAHESLYWELHRVMTAQAVRFGDWKAVREAPNRPLKLYDLVHDPNEDSDVSSAHTDVVRRAERLMDEAHEPHPDWPLVESTWRRELIAAWKSFGDWAYEADSAGIWYGELLVWARDLLR